jgi:molecular chaperone Hsp33
MKNQDKLQRFLFENVFVRGEIAHLDTTYQTILSQHDYPPVIKQLVGEALVLVTLLTGMIKFNGRLSLQFQGKSGLKLVLAQANHQLQLRALAQWDGELDEEQLLEDLKKGILAIIMDPDSTTQRYQGMVAFRGNSLAESIEGYFQDSEQLPTRIWIAMEEQRGAGMLLQTLPQQAEADISPEETQAAWENLTILANTVKPDELLNLPPATLLKRLFVEEDVRVFDPLPIEFKCSCSLERGQNAILLLGRVEAEEELNLKQVIVVQCDFCNTEYIFDRVDVENIFRQGGMPPSSTQIH